MDDSAIGLADNGNRRFCCGTCEYQKDGVCQNPRPKLKGKKVEKYWCCNHYDHDGMKVIIA